MARTEIVVDGVLLSPDSDFVGLLRRQLLGEGIFESKGAYGPEDGVVRVLGAAQGTPIEPSVKDAIMTLVTDRDPTVRAGAAMAVGTYPRTFGAQPLVDILDKNLALFRGTPALARGFQDLEWELLQAVAATESRTPEIMERFKAAVMDPANGGRFIGLVTRADPGWVIEHAREITLSQAPRVDGVFAGLPDVAKREAYAKALRDEPAPFRREVVARLSKSIPSQPERDRLSKILGG